MKFDLRREDCITGMSRLAEGSVDLVVTSPPYNLGISYGKYSDRQDRRSYLGWCGEWAGQVRRVLRPDGSFFLNIGAAPSNPMLMHETLPIGKRLQPFVRSAILSRSIRVGF